MPIAIRRHMAVTFEYCGESNCVRETTASRPESPPAQTAPRPIFDSPHNPRPRAPDGLGSSLKQREESPQAITLWASENAGRA